MSVEADIAVIMNDIGHIKETLEDIKKTGEKQDDRMAKLEELVTKQDKRLVKTEEKIETHNKYFIAIGTVLLALGGWLATVFAGRGA